MSANTILSLICALVASPAIASDFVDFTFDGSETNFAFALEGTKTKTIYREEEYQSTCSRQEEYTAYRTECDYRTVQSCREEGGGQSCTSVPECRDVDRPVCNSSGCTNHPTRECTTRESCTSEPSRTVCTDSREATNCRQVPYSDYRTVEYACTKTRMIPIGTEIVEQMAANVKIAFAGDHRDLGGKDSFRLSLAHGNDLTRDDLAVVSTATGDSHFFKLVKVSESKKPTGPKKATLDAVYRIEAIPYAKILARKTLLGEMDAIRGAITFTTTGEKIDSGVILSIVAKKDRVIGGLKKDYERTFGGESLTVKDISGGQNVQVDLGACLKKRPYEFKLSLSRDVAKMLGEGVLNSSTVAKAQKEFTSTLVKRLKLKGDKRAECAANPLEGTQSY